MTNIAVISHANDIDGIGSAALIRIKYKAPLERLFFTDYSSDGLLYVEKQLEPLLKRKTDLFITDLSLNAPLVPIFSRIIKKVKSNGGKVFWFDHHPWTKQDIKEIATLCEAAVVGENRYCATEITRKELGLNGKFIDAFCKLVHYSDFNKRPKGKETYRIIGYYALSLTYYNTLKSKQAIDGKLRHLAYVVSSGKFFDNEIKSTALRFEALNNERAKEMIKKLYNLEDISIGFAKEIQSTYACAEIMKKSKRDIALYVNVSSGKAHLRSRVGDCSALARKLGGGGHVHASGFNINSSRFNNFRSERDKLAFVNYMSKVLAAK